MKAADVMSTVVEFIDGTQTVKAAAEMMGELDVGAVPVGSASAVEGVLTDRDILFRVVAAGRDVNATLVRDVASTAVIACREQDDLRVVMDLMATNHVRRLPVQDDRRRTTGWITLADVSRKLLVESRSLQDGLLGLTEHPTPA